MILVQVIFVAGIESGQIGTARVADETEERQAGELPSTHGHEPIQVYDAVFVHAQCRQFGQVGEIHVVRQLVVVESQFFQIDETLEAFDADETVEAQVEFFSLGCELDEQFRRELMTIAGSER